MRVYVRNQQQVLRVDVRQVKGVLRALAQKAQRWSSPAAPWQELTLVLLDDAGMGAINQMVMGHTGTTDVISQAYLPLPGETPGLTGELFVNVEAANRATRRNGWHRDRELALYLAHGCDHLAGGTDETRAAHLRMRRRELAWLQQVSLPPLFV